MLRTWRMGWLIASGCGWAFAGAAAVAIEPDERDAEPTTAAAAGAVRAERDAPWRADRLRVEAARRQLEMEVAELHTIVEAQKALVEYVESGGGTDDEKLDRMLCDESALRPLCAELVETFVR